MRMKPTHPYHWLLFDADGTLFDFDLAETTALERTFQQYFKLSFNADTADAYRRVNRQVWEEYENGQITAQALQTARFERLFQALAIDLPAGDPAVLAFSRLYLQHLSQSADLLPGAREAIQTLRRQYHLGIITNGLKDVQRPRLAASGMAPFFEVIAISEEMGVAKPDPRFFEQTLARMGCPPRETVLVIGDSLRSDIRGGNQSGLDTCWFNPAGLPAQPHIPATYEIRALAELIDGL